MRNRVIVAIACLGITSGLIALAKPPTSRPTRSHIASTARASSPSNSAMAGPMGDIADDSMAGGNAMVQTSAQPLTKAQNDFFETHVRPILATNCYKCHSTEQRKSKGGLVLDTREGWQKGGEDGQVIVPGAPEKSMLIKAIGYTDADLQMPPDNHKLRDSDITTLTEWVKMGAPDPRVPSASKLTGLNDKARAHWSYQPLKNPAVPSVKDTQWVKNAIDAFVLAKLEQNQIHPSPSASREALIRRATYDLIGLPPTPEEVKAFVDDTSPDAFEKLVDRLLASPHFGERWGRYWLDTARYSDTTGVDKVVSKSYRSPYAWTYRDYVINSFNSDKPYDQFLKEQLAADQLPETKSDPARLAALGFITVGKRFQNPNDTIDERIDAVSKGMLGLTVACARCHDHKFDPIPQADYYSLHGIFASITEPATEPLIGKPSDDAAYQEFQKKLADLEGKSRDLYYNLIQTKASEFRKDAAAYIMVSAGNRRGTADDILLRDKIIAEHKLDRDIYSYSSRYVHGNQEIFGPIIDLAQVPSEKFADAVPRVLAQIVAGGPKRHPINPLVAKAFAGVSADSLRTLQDVADIYGKLFAGIDSQANDYLEACRTATSDSLPGYDPALVQLASVPAEIELASNLNVDHLAEIAPTLPVSNQQGYYRLNLSDINELLLTHPGAPPRAMVVADSDRPHNSPIFIRGEALNHGPVVPRQFLEILTGPHRQHFTQGSGRLELANAIASKSNPLTSRVMVNRIWMHLFGQGFVRTPDDLGVQCEDPSHPELLDYLALQFTDNGWSIKSTIKLIMLSNTYQQCSDTNPAYAQKDSENRLLWRTNLRRLDFEALRDSLLMFTGKLDPALGGKPINLTDEPYSNRRSVYGYIDRGALPELLSQFDFADPDMANSRRTSTIVPQQALFLMNSPLSVDVARKVTSRPEFLNATDDTARIAALYVVLYQRPPRPDEVQLGLDFIESTGDNQSASDTASAAKTPAQLREARIAKARAARQQQVLEANLRKPRSTARSPVRNSDGTIVDRRPLTPWEQYAQALLFTNEIAYVN